jgi:hypothetical protein
MGQMAPSDSLVGTTLWHQHLPLAAGDLLTAVVAAWPADLRRAHGLAVDDCCRGLAVSANRPAVSLAQSGVDPLPEARTPRTRPRTRPLTQVA